MTFVLIVMLTWAGQAAAITTQEFNTYEACVMAGQAVKKNKAVFVAADFVCTEKG